MSCRLFGELQNWWNSNVQMYMKGATLKIHRLSGIGNDPFVGSVQIAVRQETGVIPKYRRRKRKLTKFVSRQMCWRLTSIFEVISVALKMVRKVVKINNRTQSKSWTKEQTKTDDESNVGTIYLKECSVPFKNTSQEDILSVYTSCLQLGKFNTGWSCWLSLKQQFWKIERLWWIVSQKNLERGMDDTQETISVVSRAAKNASSGKLQKTCGNRKAEANGCSEWTACHYCCNRQ